MQRGPLEGGRESAAQRPRLNAEGNGECGVGSGAVGWGVLADDAFSFWEGGELRDGELELVTPRAELIDDVLVACQHPLTVRLDPHQSHTTREQLKDFLAMAPGGKQVGATATGMSPAYHFWMWVHDDPGAKEPRPLVRLAGGIGLRIGETPELLLYSGHVGYHVYPPARGYHYAERATRLLLPLAKRHGLREVWITCNPDNFPSRRTCERLGAELVDRVGIPRAHPFYAKGEREKCRYRVRV